MGSPNFCSLFIIYLSIYLYFYVYLQIAGGRIIGFIPSLKGIGAIENVILFVQDLNTCRRVHFQLFQVEFNKFVFRIFSLFDRFSYQG